MADEITNAEVGRRLDNLDRHVRDEFGDLSRQLDRFVLREVYQAERESRDARLSALEQAQREEADQRKALARWVISAVIIPIAVLAVTVVLNVMGPA